MTEQLLRIKEVADRLAVSRWTVYRLLEADELSSIQVGRNRRVKASELDAYIERISKAA